MPDAEILSVKVKDETTGVIFDVYPGGQKPFLTWTPDLSAKWRFQEIKVRNNTSRRDEILIGFTVDTYAYMYLVDIFDPGETKTFGPLSPITGTTGYWKVTTTMDTVKTHEVPFMLSEGCFVNAIPFHPSAMIGYTTTGLLSDRIPRWLIYSHGATATLTVKLGWVGGAKGWGGAWYIDGVFKPNPVTITVDHNITAQSLPGAFSPFLPLEDINLDGYVGVDDIVLVAEHYGTEPGDPNWDPRYDVTGDGYVGVDDIVLVADAFGVENEAPPRTESLYEARVAVSTLASQAMAGAAATAAGAILAETARKIMREVKK
jgi:hypothetical protein